MYAEILAFTVFASAVEPQEHTSLLCISIITVFQLMPSLLIKLNHAHELQICSFQNYLQNILWKSMCMHRILMITTVTSCKMETTWLLSLQMMTF